MGGASGSTAAMNAMVGERLYGNPDSHILQIRGVSRPPRRGVPISSLCEGSGYYTGGPGTMRGPGPRGGPVSLGGPEPRLLAHEFLPLPGHVVSPDPSQLWNGPDRCWENRTPDRRGPAVWI